MRYAWRFQPELVGNPEVAPQQMARDFVYKYCSCRQLASLVALFA